MGLPLLKLQSKMNLYIKCASYRFRDESIVAKSFPRMNV